jgi:uncharacterized C2H2 Zn-finger protein
MPNATSKNWDAFNKEELDRRHKEAEEKRALRPETASPAAKLKSIVVSVKARGQSRPAREERQNSICIATPDGSLECPKCQAKLNRGNVENHLRKAHGFIFGDVKKRKAANNRSAHKAFGRENTVVRRVKPTTAESLAKELEAHLPRYILWLVRREGFSASSLSTVLPYELAERIRAQFKLPR